MYILSYIIIIGASVIGFIFFGNSSLAKIIIIIVSIGALVIATRFHDKQFGKHLSTRKKLGIDHDFPDDEDNFSV